MPPDRGASEPPKRPSTPHKERAVRTVFYLTLGTMVAEILFGYLASSMALVADGWHMASHASALLLAWGVERASRDAKIRARFLFDPALLRALGGYTSALLLGGFSALMAVQCVGRVVFPKAIAYGPALVVAIVGLGVNGASFVILRRAGADDGDGDGDGDARSNEDDAPKREDDPNHRAAVLHVLADAGTSVLAVVALTVGRAFDFPLLDPLIGLVGAAVVGWWAYGLVRNSAAKLVRDRAAAPPRRD
jgi:cation diffusion facilitator family transporter